MGIEKCQNFKRDFTVRPPRQEVQWCTVKGADMQCGGFSDFCPIPENFVPQREIPQEMILFPGDERLIMIDREVNKE